MGVRIYQLDKGFSQWVWLCLPHKKRRQAMDPDLQIKSDEDPPHDGLICLDCHFGEPTTIPTTEGAHDGPRI